MKVFSTIKLGVPSVNLTLIYILSEDVCNVQQAWCPQLLCSRPAPGSELPSTPPMSGLSLSFPLSHPPGLPITETSARTLITVEKKVCFGSQYQRIQSVVIWLMVGG